MMATLPQDFPLPENGSLVGSWRVDRPTGSGSHGVVFRAVHKDRPSAGGYALKLALNAGDERFEREAHLLSRVSHPSVPRLEGRGIWRSPDGEAYPYVVMQWVEGLHLYAWALEHGLTLRQAIGPLAQVARALQATHPHGVHRDVKGGNIRVNDEGHAVLLDFGSCWYAAASPLTGNDLPPVTERYRSPQQLMFGFAVKGGWWQGPYENTPADDLYALGVTAYRLLAGAYPPRAPDNEDGSQKPVRLKAPRGLEQVCPELGQLIERLLAEDPLERGTAQAVAEELEALRESSRPALDERWGADASRQPTEKAGPPVPPKQTPPPAPREPAQPPAPRKREWRELMPRVVLGGLCLAVALLCVLPPGRVDRRYMAATEPESESQVEEKPDAGTSVGEEGLASVSPAETPHSSKEKVSREMPDQPSKDQKRPPCNQRAAIEINGGCWRLARAGADTAPCDSDLYEHGGRCYSPILKNADDRIPTSEEPRK
jgi:serine/threonine protein kinase